MSQVVFTKVIKRLMNVFGAPNSPDQNAFFDEFDKALRGYTADVLEAAVDRVMKVHVFASWPTVGEVTEAVQSVLAARGGPRAPEHVKFSALEPEPGKKYVDPQRVKDLVASFAAKLEENNDFPAIQARCPIGGTIDVSKPWGEEVTDKNGNVVPIKKKQRMFG